MFKLLLSDSNEFWIGYQCMYLEINVCTRVKLRNVFVSNVCQLVINLSAKPLWPRLKITKEVLKDTVEGGKPQKTRKLGVPPMNKFRIPANQWQFFLKPLQLAIFSLRF